MHVLELIQHLVLQSYYPLLNLLQLVFFRVRDIIDEQLNQRYDQFSSRPKFLHYFKRLKSHI